MNNLLLATDLGQNSDRAMERALKLACEAKIPLHILHVLNSKDQNTSNVEDTIRAYMKDNKDADHADIQITVINSPKPYDEIASYASEIGTDLIIMGTHAQPKLSDLFFGTTVERVLVSSPAPVLMVKDKPLGPYNNILCGIDFAPASKTAFEKALSIAPDASFHVLHACKDGPIYPSQQMLSVMGISTMSNEEREQHMRDLLTTHKNAFKEKHDGKELNVRHSFENSDPYYAIIKETEKQKYDLITLGAYCEPSEKIGAVTDSLMSDAPCDILVSGAAG